MILPRSSEFLASAPTLRALPPPGPPEIAFAGRSNVGKSSLINALLGRRALVRVSSRPGCTRALTFLRVVTQKRELRFVDLPGYGYAQVSKAERAAWASLVRGYFERGRPVAAVVLLCDARRGPEEEEKEIAGGLGIPLILVVTKVDKMRRHERGPAVTRAAAALGLPSAIPFSSKTLEGRDALWSRLMEAVG